MRMGLARRPRRRLPVGTAGSPERWPDLVPRCSPDRADHRPGAVLPARGAKARECDPYSPARWVSQKIDSAVARYGLEQFGADQYWQVAHIAGLTPRNSAYWTALLRAARQCRAGGHVSGQDRNRLSDGRPRRPSVHREALGWVTLVHTPDRRTGLPRTDRLSRSPTDSDEPAIPFPPVPTPTPQGPVAGSSGLGGSRRLPAPDRRPTWPVGCRCPRARPAACWRPWSGRR